MHAGTFTAQAAATCHRQDPCDKLHPHRRPGHHAEVLPIGNLELGNAAARRLQAKIRHQPASDQSRAAHQSEARGGEHPEMPVRQLFEPKAVEPADALLEGHRGQSREQPTHACQGHLARPSRKAAQLTPEKSKHARAGLAFYAAGANVLLFAISQPYNHLKDFTFHRMLFPAFAKYRIEEEPLTALSPAHPMSEPLITGAFAGVASKLGSFIWEQLSKFAPDFPKKDKKTNWLFKTRAKTYLSRYQDAYGTIRPIGMHQPILLNRDLHREVQFTKREPSRALRFPRIYRTVLSERCEVCWLAVKSKPCMELLPQINSRGHWSWVIRVSGKVHI